MKYVKSLKAVTRADKDLCGQRAVDLAALQEHDYAVPLTFVVTNEAFEAFVSHNRLQQRIGEALAGYADKTLSYQLVRELLLNGKFPKEMVAELVESYESLSVDPDAPVDSLIEAGNAPFVTVILSTNHAIPEESTEGVVLNVHGLEELLLAVKECWACLFTPAMLRFRKEAGIGEKNLNAGVLVQHMVRSETTGEAWSANGSNMEELVAKAYYGALDVGHDIAKDEWRLTREYLRPVYQRVAVQTEMLTRDDEDRLGKQPIGKRGEEQKLTDREMIELGRLAKKASIALDCQVKLFLDIHKELFRLLLCDRLLLTKGSVKLQGYRAEERIEEEEPEPMPEETEEATAAVPAEEEVTAETVKEAFSAEELAAKSVVEEEGFIVAVDEETGKEEVQDHEVTEQEAAEEETTKEGVPASGGEEKTDDEETAEPETGRVTEEEPVEEEEPATEPEPAGEEDGEDETEEEGERAEATVIDEEDSIFAGVIDEENDEGQKAEESEEQGTGEEEESGKEEETDEEREENEEERERDEGEARIEKRRTERTLDEAFDEVAAALTGAYERRFRHAPPASVKDLFFELSEEVVIPHEELIGTLIMIHEEDREHGQEEEKRVLDAIDEFLERLE